jgi:hypothetical protein
MFTATFTQATTAPAAAVFALWEAVAEWPTWDESLVAATLDGPFEAGTTGTLQPNGAPEGFPYTLTSVMDGQGFADETIFGPMTLRFIHEVTDTATGSLITLTVEVEGPDAEGVGTEVTGDSQDSLIALARAAEARTQQA